MPAPSFQPSPYPKLPDISIAAEGFDKLLVGLNPHKAAGPDKFKPIVLQTLQNELAPILQLIFQRSLDTGKLPDIWKEANVSPIFKKGEKSDPSNYRPIHSPVSFVRSWSTLLLQAWLNDILYDLQHGFREKRSCETQLIMLVDELAKITDGQTD